MVRTFAGLALVTLVLAVPASAQDEIVVTGKASVRLPKRTELIPDSRFAGAGHREITALGDGRVRLVYTLMVEAPEPLPEDAKVALDWGGFSLNWMRDALEQQIEGIDDVALVCAATSRAGGEPAIFTREKRVEIVGTPDAAASAEEFLERFVRDNRRMVLIESFVTSRRVEVAATGGPQIELLDRAAFDVVRGEPEKLGVFNVIACPRVLTFGGQEAIVEITNQIAYVKEWELEVVREQSIANPVVDVVNDGLVLTVTPVIEGTNLHLAVNLTVSRVQQPIARSTIKIGIDEHEVQVDRPEVVVATASCPDVTMIVGEPTLRISNVNVVDGNGTECVEVLLRTSIVEPSEVDADPPTGVVLGFDHATREAFIRVNRASGETEIRGRTITITSDGGVPVRGTVLEIGGELLRARLIDGEAKAGDAATVEK